MNYNQLVQDSPSKLSLSSPATEVKMFVHRNPADAEEALRLWLNENDVHIHHVAQSQSERNGSFVFVVTIFYLKD